MKPDRKAIMRDAHRRFRRRLGAARDLVLSWAEALRRAWAAWRWRAARRVVYSAGFQHHDDVEKVGRRALHRCF
jgi:hypothetical protein